MKTILVTGACGYIGTHVIRALSHDDQLSIIGCDLYIDEEKKTEGVQYVSADILSPSFSMQKDLPVIPDVCVHLAWRNGFAHNEPSHMLDLSGHFAFLEKAMTAGVAQIAVMGSMHEVGYWEGAISADTPCSPQSLYGISKNALRQAFLLRAHTAGVKAQWLRGFYITGDDEGSQSVFGKILRADRAGEKTFPFTSGKNKYDFLSVREIAEQIAACVTQDSVLGVINCCSGKPLSLGERVEQFIVENGLSITLDYGAYPDRPYDSPVVWGDAAEITRIMEMKRE